MKPILFSLGPLEVRAYGFFFAAAFVLCFAFGQLRGKKMKISSEKVWDMAFYIMFSSLAGAKLLSIIVEWKYIMQHGLTLDILRSGFVFLGGLIGGTAGGFYYVLKNKLDYRKYMDFVAPIVPFGHAVGRMGCFFNGCCYGRPTDSCIGIVFPAIGDGVPRIPSQLIEVFFLLIIVGTLLFWHSRRKYKGQLFILYITWYSIFRFINEFFRGDPRGGLMFFSTSQWISLFAIVAITIFGYKLKYNKKEAPDA